MVGTFQNPEKTGKLDLTEPDYSEVQDLINFTRPVIDPEFHDYIEAPLIENVELDETGRIVKTTIRPLVLDRFPVEEYENLLNSFVK